MFCETCIHYDVCKDDDYFNPDDYSCKLYRNKDGAVVVLNWDTYRDIMHQLSLARTNLSKIKKSINRECVELRLDALEQLLRGEQK